MQINSVAYLVDLNSTAPVASGGTPAAAATSSAPAPSVDRVELSSAGRSMQKLKQELAALPEVRRDRVALAKQNLQGGYRVDASVLAQKMMEGAGRG